MFAQPFVQAQISDKKQIGDRWIPVTKCREREKKFPFNDANMLMNLNVSVSRCNYHEPNQTKFY